MRGGPSAHPLSPPGEGQISDELILEGAVARERVLDAQGT